MSGSDRSFGIGLLAGLGLGVLAGAFVHRLVGKLSVKKFPPAIVRESYASITGAAEVLVRGRVAVVTGAGSGIGLAAARDFCRRGMKVVLADIDARDLEDARVQCAAEAVGGDASVLGVVVDVSKLEDVEKLRTETYAKFGKDIAVLFNNAGIGGGGGPVDNLDRWREVMSVNLWGVVHGVQVFVPGMIKQGSPAVVINTGSKQGITTPPGDTAYNISKSAVKILTEALQHYLRNDAKGKVSAFLLVPGWTNTSIKLKEMRRLAKEGEFHIEDVAFHERKPALGAWMPEQVVKYMLERLSEPQPPFYIICPDNELSNQKFKAAIQWAADDLIHDRVPLSRWAEEYKPDFSHYVKGL